MTAREIPLSAKKANGRVALVDEADYDLVMQYRWNVKEGMRPNGGIDGPYARTGVRRPGGRTETILMHKLITGWPQTDHIDHDGLNNQRYNLRDATSVQNSRNRIPRIGHSSQFKGVGWDRKKRKWRVRIFRDGRAICLGYFADEGAAARAYDAAALEHFGHYAYLNFPEGRAVA